ncbi:hypothetical protein M5K25_013031 [Dendrobium thyrsiflorum]|uniref:Protein arginine methyltransferase NDUFAF7 n=1 Tax=Dendrobium thyrsiflorum TaxID=117978 RepID=A0ABD0V5A4_DENTH
MLRKSLSFVLSHRIRQAVPFLSSHAGASFSFSSSSNTLNPCTSLEDQTNENNQDSRPTETISIDRSGLYNPQDHFHKLSADSKLVNHLKSIIKFRGGPISIAEYMGEVLTNPNCGFYINRDVFGACGDFVTSPEVSQMFGEMVGVWTMCMWEQLGRPAKVNLVEFGPGRGTLMADLLRGSSKFVDFSKSLDIHLVECSPTLQKLQYNTLKCIDEAISEDNTATRTTTTLNGASVLWHADPEGVPSGLPTIIIAHEFYDALPIHQFQKTFRAWSEKMIDVSEDSSFRFVLSPQPTPASLLYLRKRCEWADKEKIAKIEQIEVCPRAVELTHQIAKRISIDGGGALIIDYGKNEIISDSLQAIRKHKFVHILDDPGSADLSAYVDFAAIRHSAEEASENISVYGPITQSQLLGSLGINFRVEALLKNCTKEQAESLRTGYWRLVGDGEAPFWEGTEEQKPIGMGNRYLAMAIVNKNQGIPIPFE